MPKIFQIIIDFIFPPSPEELKLREIAPERVYSHLDKAAQTEFSFIKSLFSYKNPLTRELIWQIKYKKNKHCLSLAAFALNTELEKENLEKIILVPIPISKKRREERGYNQCELIINEIVRISPNIRKDFDLLIRTKDIEKQTFKNRKERIQNTSKIFQVKKLIPRDNKIIIIDDVTTTGSTIKEARETLMEAGHENVLGMTIAH